MKSREYNEPNRLAENRRGSGNYRVRGIREQKRYGSEFESNYGKGGRDRNENNSKPVAVGAATSKIQCSSHDSPLHLYTRTSRRQSRIRIPRRSTQSTQMISTYDRPKSFSYLVQKLVLFYRTLIFWPAALFLHKFRMMMRFKFRSSITKCLEVCIM